MSLAERLEQLRKDSAFKSAVWWIKRGKNPQHGGIDDLLWMAAYRYGFRTRRDGTRFMLGGAK